MKYHNITAILVSVGILLTGCMATTTPAPKRVVEFNEAEFASLPTKGTGIIMGQAFLKTRGGEVRLGAGEQVILTPVTSYTKEFHERAVLKGQNLGKSDQAYFKYRRTTKADAQGSFEFKDVPAGEYYLWCKIVWEARSQYGLSPTGGTAYAKVKIGDGETVKAIVTR